MYNAIMNFLGTTLGYVQYFCYKLFANYGASLVLFTLFTKLLLIPVAVWVQKNSVKLVKMQPELYDIKALYYGNNDKISEKQLELYKKNKYNPFLDFIPLILQLVLLMGVVNAVYAPLENILHIDKAYINEMTSRYTEITGEESSSPQIGVVSVINNADFSGVFAEIPQDVTAQIRSLDMRLIGKLNFAQTPSKAGGIFYVIPLLAALSSLIMCAVQNRINVLQAEQTKASKYGMAAFSVALSLYLGCFVPVGVGWYWIWSNLLSIPQMFLMNIIIDPKKSIDYEKLETSKNSYTKVLQYHRNVSATGRRDPNHKRSKADSRKFGKYGSKQVVFYSEKNGFYKYYKKVIEYIISKTDVVVHYITSDINDEVFALASPQFIVYYIDEMSLITTMMKMDADIVVLTMPDLDTYHIKRSYVRKDTEYIFLPHSVNSDNLTLRQGALDNFDTLFAYGEKCLLETRETEKIYGIKERKVVHFGSSLIDEMIEKYNALNLVGNDIKTILIAPSWQPDNLIDLCGDDVIKALIGKGNKVIFRPHPQYVRLFPDKLREIGERYKDYADFILQTDFSSNETVYSADVLITDWSSIGMEYAFSTLKPVIYINTPMKILNPEYERLETVPIDIAIRDEIGLSVDTDKLETLGGAVEEVLTNSDKYREMIENCRARNIYNVGSAGESGGKYIIKRLIEYASQESE